MILSQDAKAGDISRFFQAIEEMEMEMKFYRFETYTVKAE